MASASLRLETVEIQTGSEKVWKGKMIRNAPEVEVAYSSSKDAGAAAEVSWIRFEHELVGAIG